MPVPILKQGGCLIATVAATIADSEWRELQDGLLERVGQFRIRGVIVDVTELDVMDSFAAQHAARDRRRGPLAAQRPSWSASSPTSVRDGTARPDRPVPGSVDCTRSGRRVGFPERARPALSTGQQPWTMNSAFRSLRRAISCWPATRAATCATARGFVDRHDRDRHGHFRTGTEHRAVRATR